MATVLTNQMRRSRPKTKVKEANTPVWPAAFFLYASLLPPEVVLYVGSFRLGAYRIALFLLIPWVIRQLSARSVKLGPIDFIVIVTAIWLPFSFAYNYNFRVGLEAGGGQIVDILLAYLVGRCSINSLPQLRRLLLVMLPGLAVTCVSMMLESVSGKLFVRDSFRAIFGSTQEVGNRTEREFRFGLLRAYGPFIHPIHAGIFLSTFFPLYFTVFRKPQYKFGGPIIGAFSIFTMSSAGILQYALNIFMLCFDYMQKFLRDFSWKVALVFVAVGMAAIQVFSQNGLVSIIYRYLTLNPRSGWYRTQIWNYTIDDVIDNPLFGIGYENYTRPEWFWGTYSIDAHYLSMAVKFGLVPALLYFSVAIAIIIALAKCASLSARSYHRDIFAAYAICISTVVIVLFTVAFWGSILAWFNFMLGIALSLARNPANTPRARKAVRKSRRHKGANRPNGRLAT